MAYSPGRFTEIIIYSLRSNSWNIVNKSHKTYLCPDGGLACFQGILHWLEKPWGDGHDSVIGSFDIGNKAFKEIPLPQYFSNNFDRICVRLLGGCLSLIGSEYQNGCEIWMMQNYGVQQSWTKMFIIHETGDLGGFRYLFLRNSFKNRMILVQVDDGKSYMYDLKHEKFIKLEINLSGCCTLDFFGSLVSPNNLFPMMK
ncbi:hypothetical protein MKW92_001376 [Papaver armeniacum]|nr:hypothetical protein MKW92_001376 [Papaver armeniacum]